MPRRSAVEEVDAESLLLMSIDAPSVAAASHVSLPTINMTSSANNMSQTTEQTSKSNADIYKF